MQETAIIMLKDMSTGLFERELATCKISEHAELLSGMFAARDGDGINLHMRLTTERDVKDWEFSAVYDYYDDEGLLTLVSSVREVDEGYNPAWEAVFPFSADTLEQTAARVLSMHAAELSQVYEAISGRESEYAWNE